MARKKSPRKPAHWRPHPLALPKPKMKPKKIRRVKLPSVIKKLRFLRSVRGWIDGHPDIANAIVWRGPNGLPRAYPQWSAWEQDKLRDTVANIRVGVYSGLPAAPPVTLTLSNSGDLFSAGLDPQLAWEYFIAYVAHSIVVEQAKWVPWSVAAYTIDELSLLFDSRSLFEWLAGPQKYGILRDHNVLFKHGAATPGDPVRTFNLPKEQIDRSCLRSTITALAVPRATAETRPSGHRAHGRLRSSVHPREEVSEQPQGGVDMSVAITRKQGLCLAAVALTSSLACSIRV